MTFTSEIRITKIHIVAPGVVLSVSGSRETNGGLSLHLSISIVQTTRLKINCTPQNIGLVSSTSSGGIYTNINL
jgi:hypothetical protein